MITGHHPRSPEITRDHRPGLDAGDRAPHEWSSGSDGALSDDSGLSWAEPDIDGGDAASAATTEER